MNSRRVVFDTNIFLSAFLFGGNPELVLRMARAGKLKLIVSSAILVEFASILKKKVSWNDDDVHEALMVIGRCADLIKPQQKLSILRDDADNRVLECALEGRADYIISGDHHLLDLEEFCGIPILPASAFLARK